jgi:very-short-patch-repair endonuclease
MDDERDMSFLPVPDPTLKELVATGYMAIDPDTRQEIRLKQDPSAREWAKHLGLNIDYEVPALNLMSSTEDKHSDAAIQTLMFPSELETRLRSMRQKANLAMEETGANILYLAMGFLEWRENKDIDRSRLAPLYLIPTILERGKLNKKTNTYEYRLSYSGEDVLTNISLREKLRNDFGIALPELEDADRPEDYFKNVADSLAASKPDWKVMRYVTLAHLNFSKQLMYIDLDPESWPKDASILDHPLIGRCLVGSVEGASGGGDSIGFGEEHSIDDIADIHEAYPVIDDADSSQHSALIDVIRGKDLVIEGPPGTGKSQTITNLIAAAIAQKKRVLFVAEKAAALMVVKHRLDLAGLGDFCLELHSHRSQKRRVLDDIARRIKNGKKYRKPEEINVEIQQYEALKAQLGIHARKVNRQWKNTGFSIHEILAAATRYREDLSISPALVEPERVDGDTFTPAARQSVLSSARTLATVFDGVQRQAQLEDSITSHPWFGIGKSTLQAYEQDEVVQELKGWQAALQELLQAGSNFAVSVGGSADEMPDTCQGAAELASVLSRIPASDDSDPLFAIPKLIGARAKWYRNTLDIYKAIQNYFGDLSQHIQSSTLDGARQRENLLAASPWFTKNVAPEATLSQLQQAPNLVNAVETAVASLREPIVAAREQLGPRASELLAHSLSGLREFADIVDLLTALPAESWDARSDTFDEETLDQLLPKLAAEKNQLQAAHDELSDTFNMSRLPAVEALREINEQLLDDSFFRWLKADWRRAKKDLKAIRAAKSTRYSDLSETLNELVTYCDFLNEFESNTEYRNTLGTLFTGTKTAADKLIGLRAWYKAIRKKYGIGFGPDVAVGDAIIGMPLKLARALRSLSDRSLRRQIEQVESNVAALAAIFPNERGLQDEHHTLVGPTAIVTVLAQRLRTTLSSFVGPFVSADNKLSECSQVLRRLEKLEALIRSWQERDLIGSVFDGRVELSTGLNIVDNSTLPALMKLADIVTLLSNELVPEMVREKVRREPTTSTLDLISMRNRLISTALEEEAKLHKQFAIHVGLNEQEWIKTCGAGMSGLAGRNKQAIENASWLGSWLEYLRARHQVQQSGWGKIVDALESGAIRVDEITSAVALGYSDCLSRQILQSEPDLATFSGLAQKSRQDQFKDVDQKLKELQRGLVAWKASRTSVPSGVSSGRVSSWTEGALLRREIEKKRAHVPLRALVARAGSALSALKPCFMMGPMSVAQYLKPGNIQFDLVIMDEASQIKPEDALGAVARGSQLVVVGDPKQLPPTSFFDKLIDEEDIDPTAGEESESILDASLTTFPARRLRWHYRSQHESLIAFSNAFFYDSDLVIFPSPHNTASNFGVKFTKVKRGRFVNQQNVEEATLIAKAVRRHVFLHPDESIGVVAMSAKQSEQIEFAIETEAKNDEEFRDALDKSEGADEPLFVKNLENVQGDERDVIYISMTYGPAEVGGRTAQRFGPINTAHGWRRLNVLFTRSKKRMHVFSSMSSEDIVIAETSSRGVKALKHFLDFSERGHLAVTEEHTDRGPDSDFEIAVAAALSNHGFECVPQVGVAGFFLDIAVRDPGNPGRYLMAVECDGATYHSAKSARDRDRLRQEILERLGWRVRRIWSTDWFNNPQAQLVPIIEELNQLKTAIPIQGAEPVEEIDESEEIAAVAHELAEEDEFVATFVREQVSLRAKLERYQAEVVCRQEPDVDSEKRLLRPAMLEALLEYEPTSVWEFQQEIPPFLRNATDSRDGKFLSNVLDIIRDSQQSNEEVNWNVQ